MQESYKVNRALAEACRHDIEQYKCRPHQGDSEIKHIRMSRILLCLEGQIHEGTWRHTSTEQNI